ncbi:hypothetical protein [Desulfoscipio gibsoniae]
MTRQDEREFTCDSLPSDIGMVFQNVYNVYIEWPQSHVGYTVIGLMDTQN